MPDLRDDLGRLADFVGEPRALDDLAAARRRRERRRRAEGLIGGAGVFIVALLIALALRDPSDGALIPGATSSPRSSSSARYSKIGAVENSSGFRYSLTIRWRPSAHASYSLLLWWSSGALGSSWLWVSGRPASRSTMLIRRSSTCESCTRQPHCSP